MEILEKALLVNAEHFYGSNTSRHSSPFNLQITCWNCSQHYLLGLPNPCGVCFNCRVVSINYRRERQVKKKALITLQLALFPLFVVFAKPDISDFDSVAQAISTTAVVGGDTAGPSPFGETAWGLLCDGAEDFSPSDLQELKSATDAHAELRSIAMVAAIGRAKVTMGGISPWTAPDAPVEIAAGDLLLLLRSALKGID